MTTEDRDRLREKQDRLIALVEKKGLDTALQISQEWQGSPPIHELRHTIYPEYEAAIDWAIKFLEEGLIK